MHGEGTLGATNATLDDMRATMLLDNTPASHIVAYACVVFIVVFMLYGSIPINWMLEQCQTKASMVAASGRNSSARFEPWAAASGRNSSAKVRTLILTLWGL